MKKLSYIITIISSLFLLSCSTLKPTKQVDDNQKKIEKEEKRIEKETKAFIISIVTTLLFDWTFFW